MAGGEQLFSCRSARGLPAKLLGNQRGRGEGEECEDSVVCLGGCPSPEPPRGLYGQK